VNDTKDSLLAPFDVVNDTKDSLLAAFDPFHVVNETKGLAIGPLSA
jgi:hypothetical protein